MNPSSEKPVIQQPNNNHNTKATTPPPQTAVDVPAEESRNDNSNPQQGTGSGMRNKAPAVTASTEQTPNDNAAAPESNAVSYEIMGPPRRSLAIPPFKKDSRKLFVGGLPSDVTDAEFRTFFEEYGELVDSVVMFDYETQRSRGFGFVTFKDPEVAAHMLDLGRDMNDQTHPRTGRVQMRDKLVEIKTAEPKESRGNSRYGSRRHNGHDVSTVTAKVVGHVAPGPAQPACYYGDGAPTYYPMVPPSYYGPGMVAPGYMPPQAYVFPQASQPPMYAPMNDLPPMDPYAVAGTPYNGMMPPYAFYPVAQPQHPAYASASVMQPAAPGIPAKMGDIMSISHYPPAPANGYPATP